MIVMVVTKSLGGQMPIKNLLMLTTGGTLAGNVAGKSEKRNDEEISVEEQIYVTVKPTLKAIKKEWNTDIQIHHYPVDNIDSSDILPIHWVKISKTIKEKYDEYDAFIVTHGTNTMGYTCSALVFALENINKPVVVTGSQIPFGEPGSDALLNLDNAIRVAVYPVHEIKGIVCVFGSHIISGARTKKSTEFDYDAFQSFSTASLGRIGRIIDANKENIDRHNSYLNKHSPLAFTSNKIELKNTFDMRIASITEFPGMSTNIIETLSEKNKGIVFRSFGAGDVSTNLHNAFEKLKEQKIPIVVTTQAPNGYSNFRVNEPGEQLLKKELAIPAYDMSIEAMTIKLSWMLGQNWDYNKICTEMTEDYHGEIHKRTENK